LSQSGGFNNILENSGINLGGSITTVNRQRDLCSTRVNSKRGFDWSGVDHRRAWSSYQVRDRLTELGDKDRFIYR
jgi:hypothetical protein